MGMQKKLEAARHEGYLAGLKSGAAQKELQKSFLDGIKVGADAANEVWSSAIQNTHGVGTKTIQKIYAQAEQEHQQRKVERKMLASDQPEEVVA
ncbi:hypothetical protein GZH47_33450 (plasmid) [Paenibacillus rhizovicinus]|uniref:Uncharacterized protein n=1 Tax=Paenibacillus rhizovicinus TaxID=2704463 RepID=A0A6C0PBM7_9BACL|nr:hypothetical protein [Paenibacillus rhizovicinus]QHW35801.1 hypothetical protein GZH47_33450 [Paenibacillus rhizovicinus]